MFLLLCALLVLGQDADAACASAEGRLADAAARVDGFDLEQAARLFRREASGGCAEAAVAAAYLEGWIAARAAYRQGGTETALAPVRQAIVELEALGRAGSAPAEIAGFLLRAASAGAQSEREEMAIFLTHAAALEDLQRTAGEPGAPAVSAYEAAGDLWLQVHRFEGAQRAYAQARERVGSTPAVRIGLARTAARLQDVGAACGAYAGLIEWWGDRAPEPGEIAEARAFLAGTACPPAPAQP